ncbi:MAG: hypothetical protein LM577_02445 [Thermoproteaceae archaeon]|jgi:hypothetical protein|nr:hypothetical protein [Thermoproteaceae archaeon]
MRFRKAQQTALELLVRERRAALLQKLSLAAAAAGLALFTIPALLDHVLGGALQALLPQAVYNAIHELRHLLGIPCH